MKQVRGNARTVGAGGLAVTLQPLGVGLLPGGDGPADALNLASFSDSGGCPNNASELVRCMQDPLERASSQVFFASTHVPGVPPGTAIASPSTSAPDYFYHWVRDASITFARIAKIPATGGGGSGGQIASRGIADGPPRHPEIEALMAGFAHVSRGHQESPTVAGLGEPKFLVDGTPFNGPWGRPQNDGPALRALVLTRWAQYLLGHGGIPGAREYVSKELYDGALPTQSVVKRDLEYVAAAWRDASVDVWEEVRGTHFFTRLLQRAALDAGAELAESLGDSGAAAWYRVQAREIGASLAAHWSAKRGYLIATLDKVSGPPAKTSDLDVSVVLAALLAERFDPRIRAYAPWDGRVLATAVRLVGSMRGLYAINANTSAPAVVGRYPEDVYDGVGFSRGNPWPLATAALAHQAFIVARRWCRLRYLDLNQYSRSYLSELAATRIESGLPTLIATDPEFPKAVRGVIEYGVSVLKRVRQLAAADPHGDDAALSEQWDRDTGAKQGAINLTWSAVAYLDALDAYTETGLKCRSVLQSL
nr:Glucoamylase, intracellular sporulation-specific [Polyrhizophydium stewartii]